MEHTFIVTDFLTSHHHNLAVKGLRYLSARSDLICIFKRCLSSLIHVFYKFLTVWKMCLSAFCQNFESSLFYISRICRTHVVF